MIGLNTPASGGPPQPSAPRVGPREGLEQADVREAVAVRIRSVEARSPVLRGGEDVNPRRKR